jgi:hypothetical protein
MKVMYCPNCKKEYDGRFCPECGSQLIEIPNCQGSFNLNLGDANAISGGIHMTDSHNVHNEDKSVHNTYQVAAQKTELELLQEHKVQFLDLCRKVYADGILTDDEKDMLELKRIEFNLDEHTANQLIESACKTSHRKKSLNAKDALTIKLITQLIKENDVERLESQLPRLKVLSKTYQVEDINFIYNMLLSALHPEELIEIYENQPTDEYWQTFWASIAYLKMNDVAGFEEASSKLAFYTNYTDGNELLLQALSLSHDFGTDNETVQETLKMLNESSISSELRDFWQAICQSLNFTKDHEDIAATENNAFYIEHVVPLDVCKKQRELFEQRRQDAEEEAIAILTARKSATPRKWIMAIGDAISFDEVEDFWNAAGQAVFSGMRVEEPTVKSISKFLNSLSSKDNSLVLFHPQKKEIFGYSKGNGSVGILYFITRDSNIYCSKYAMDTEARQALKDYFSTGILPNNLESWQKCCFTDLLSK